MRTSIFPTRYHIYLRLNALEKKTKSIKRLKEVVI